MNRQRSNDELDPRIHTHLNTLNSSTDQINKLEKELEDTNELFRSELAKHSGGLEKLMRKLGTSIDKARPYFMAKEEAEKLKRKCLETAVQFQKATDIHREAKKSVEQAEDRYKESQFDGACQELLNHLTIQVTEAEKQKSSSELCHRVLCEKFFEAEKKVHELGKLLQKHIDLSRPFFDMKNSLNSTLNELKVRTMQLQASIAEHKRAYSTALCQLEMISEQIHQCRQREPGEGAEEKQLKKQLDD